MGRGPMQALVGRIRDLARVDSTVLIEGETGDVKQTPEALQSWINELRERSGGGWIAIAVEQSRAALLYELMDYDFVLIYHPREKIGT